MKEIIATDKAPAAIGPYSQAVKVGNLLLLNVHLRMLKHFSKHQEHHSTRL